MKPSPPRLFIVTDDQVVARAGFTETATLVLKAGGSGAALQLRAHRTGGGALYEFARELRIRAAEAGAQLWVNDRADVAALVRADGVHLGTQSLPPEAARRLVGRNCQIGYSAHSSAEAEKSFHSGSDLVILGNVYETMSHPERRPLGVAELSAAAGRGRPIVAIGGITPERIHDIVAAGAWGAAVKTGVWDAEDPAEATATYLRALEETLAARSARGE